MRLELRSEESGSAGECECEGSGAGAEEGSAQEGAALPACVRRFQRIPAFPYLVPIS